MNTGVGNKIVLRGYGYEPIVNEAEDGTIQISTGQPCDGEEAGPLIPDPEDPQLGDAASSLTNYIGWGLAAMVGQKSALAGSTLALSMTVGFMSSAAPTAMAQQEVVIAECELAPIEVEIFVDAMADEIIQQQFQTGEFESCPPESKFHRGSPGAKKN